MVPVATSFAAERIRVERRGFARPVPGLRPLPAVPAPSVRWRGGLPARGAEGDEHPAKVDVAGDWVEPANPDVKVHRASPRVNARLPALEPGERHATAASPAGQASSKLLEINRRVTHLLDSFEASLAPNSSATAALATALDPSPFDAAPAAKPPPPRLVAVSSAHIYRPPSAAPAALSLQQDVVVPQDVSGLVQKVDAIEGKVRSTPLADSLGDVFSEVRSGIAELSASLAELRSQTRVLSAEVAQLRLKVSEKESQWKRRASVHQVQMRSLSFAYAEKVDTLTKTTDGAGVVRETSIPAAVKQVEAARSGAWAFAHAIPSDRAVLWRDHPQIMHDACLTFVQVCRDLTCEMEGVEVNCEGDSFTAAFEEPARCTEWAMRLQEDLLAASWPAATRRLPMCDEVSVAADDGDAERSRRPVWRGLRCAAGVHVGPLIDDENGGHDSPAIALCKSLAGIASSGDTLVSSTCHDEIDPGERSKYAVIPCKEEVNVYSYRPLSLSTRELRPPAAEGDAPTRSWLAITVSKHQALLSAIDRLKSVSATPNPQTSRVPVGLVALVRVQVTGLRGYWEVDPILRTSAATEALAAADAAVTATAAAQKGYVSERVADVFLVAFHRTDAALVFAVELHAAFSAPQLDPDDHQSPGDNGMFRSVAFCASDGRQELEALNVSVVVAIHVGRPASAKNTTTGCTVYTGPDVDVLANLITKGPTHGSTVLTATAAEACRGKAAQLGVTLEEHGSGVRVGSDALLAVFVAYPKATEGELPRRRLSQDSLQLTLATCLPRTEEFCKRQIRAMAELKTQIDADELLTVPAAEQNELPDNPCCIVVATVPDAGALWEKDQTAMYEAVSLMTKLFRAGAARHHGHEIQCGNVCTAVFPELVHAFAWSLDMQHRLLEVSWPEALLRCDEASAERVCGKTVWRGLRVRIGIAPGVLQGSRESGYFGLAAHQAQALARHANAGQVAVEHNVFLQLPKYLKDNVSLCNVSKRHVSGTQLTDVCLVVPSSLDARTFPEEPERFKQQRDLCVDAASIVPTLLISREESDGETVARELSSPIPEARQSRRASSQQLRVLTNELFRKVREIDEGRSAALEATGKAPAHDPAAIMAHLEEIFRKVRTVARVPAAHRKKSVRPTRRSQRPRESKPASAVQGPASAVPRQSTDEVLGNEGEVLRLRRLIVTLHRMLRVFVAKTQEYVNHLQNDLNAVRITEDEFITTWIKLLHALSDDEDRANKSKWRNPRGALSELIKTTVDTEYEEEKHASLEQFGLLTRSFPGLLCRLFTMIKSYARHANFKVRTRKSFATEVLSPF